MEGAKQASIFGAPHQQETRGLLHQLHHVRRLQSAMNENSLPHPKTSGKHRKKGKGPRSFISMAAEKTQEEQQQEEVTFRSRTSSTTLSHLSSNLFSGLRISAELRKAMAVDFKYEQMTEVQAATIPVSLQGIDLLAKAKTGTGKTIAFLIPAINRAVERPRKGKGISILVISPTRELANQIAEEGNVLIKYHRGMTLDCVVGGTNVNSDLARFRRCTPDILVGTPGRLLDHLQNHSMATMMKNMNVLILDECDRLLDMGFRQEIDKISRFLPKERQTLLFSATLPTDVQSMCERVLRPSYQLVDCVGEEESTHEHVSQTCIVSPLNQQTQDLLNVLKKKFNQPNFKIIVFFTTARLTQFYSELFNALNLPVLEIHSRKSQSHRNRVSEEFRNGTNVIMFTSDVSARGMDYPDVTLVVQVGLPANREQYIHRLGRTARGGKGGEGLLMLADFEKNFLQQVSDLPIKTQEMEVAHDFSLAISKAVAKLPEKTITAAYQAWLGFYNSNLKVLKFNKEDLVRMGNKFAHQVCHTTEPPELHANVVGKMGLRGIPGINVASKKMQGRGHDMGQRGQEKFRPQVADSTRGRGRNSGRGGPYGRSRGRQESGEAYGGFYGGKRSRKEDSW